MHSRVLTEERDAEDDTTDTNWTSFPVGIVCAALLIHAESIWHRLIVSWLLTATIWGQRSSVKSSKAKPSLHKQSLPSPISKELTFLYMAPLTNRGRFWRLWPILLYNKQKYYKIQTDSPWFSISNESQGNFCICRPSFHPAKIHQSNQLKPVSFLQD